MSYWQSRGNLSDRNDAFVDKGLGTKCGRGWKGLKGNCQRSTTKKSGKGGLGAKGQAKSAAMAEQIRKTKGLRPKAGALAPRDRALIAQKVSELEAKLRDALNSPQAKAAIKAAGQAGKSKKKRK